jgi:hypothetical protein
MFDTTYLMLIFPFVIWPFIAKLIWKDTISYGEIPINIVIGIIVVAIIYFSGRYTGTGDVEILNGQITGKTRIHDSYEQSYDCNCRSVSCGKNCTTTMCDTCYETHYTVDWDLQSTIGSYNVDYKDSILKSVYSSPDPIIYKKAKKGQHCAKEHSYTNWVKAVPESLFNTKAHTMEQYNTKIPAYPRVHSLYKFNRVITVDANVKQKQQLNNQLNKALRTLGPSKQVNIILIVTGINDPMYRYAVENKWIGGKKNDAVVFIGVDKQNNITWTDVMTFAQNKGNELFHVTMRDKLKEVGTLNETNKIVNVITSTVQNKFDRISMAEFERLKEEIDPPAWLFWLVFIIGGSISFGTTVFLHYNNITFRNGLVVEPDRSATPMFPSLQRLFNLIKRRRW